MLIKLLGAPDPDRFARRVGKIELNDLLDMDWNQLTNEQLDVLATAFLMQAFKPCGGDVDGTDTERRTAGPTRAGRDGTN